MKKPNGVKKDQLSFRIYNYIKDKYGTQPFLYSNQISSLREIFSEYVSKHLLNGDIIQLPKNVGTLFITRSNLKRKPRNKIHHDRNYVYERLGLLNTEEYYYRLKWSLTRVSGTYKSFMKSFTSREFRLKMSKMINNGKLYPLITTKAVDSMIVEKNKIARARSTADVLKEGRWDFNRIPKQ